MDDRLPHYNFAVKHYLVKAMLKPSRAYSPLGHHQPRFQQTKSSSPMEMAGSRREWFAAGSLGGRHPVVSPVRTPVLLKPSRAYSPLGHHQR